VSSDLFYRLRFFFSVFFVFFVLCSINDLAALAVQCKKQATTAHSPAARRKSGAAFFCRFVNLIEEIRDLFVSHQPAQGDQVITHSVDDLLEICEA
jgi:hypothetical protein